ncbi:hypothetical protein FB470_001192 [Amycolatopsis thermophila]|uniref:Uncharacterized protein n=1 Tax=Amycolatopsis thermophila TaxID=206084 RepID=A0ABU0EQ69_9PSEU|nr:hypothetical protein [Amycolatopsis thermophila]
MAPGRCWVFVMLEVLWALEVLRGLEVCWGLEV